MGQAACLTMGNTCAKSTVDDKHEALDGDENNDCNIDEDVQALEKTKEITKEAFLEGMLKLVNLSIEGYPRAVRSIMAKRNELLRKYMGDAEKAKDSVQAAAAKIKEEAKTWMLGLVPFIGLPATVIWPTWKMLRRVCLMAGIYGHDVMDKDTKAKIISVFGGLRSVPAGEYALETAVQMTWTVIAGPVAGVIPVGVLVGKVSNFEGHLTSHLAKETFTEGQTAVPPEVYNQELDLEPTTGDYMALAKDAGGYALISAWEGGKGALEIAWDEERRNEKIREACVNAEQLAEHAKKTGRALKAGAPAALEAAKGAAAQGLQDAQQKVKDMMKK